MLSKIPAQVQRSQQLSAVDGFGLPSNAENAVVHSALMILNNILD